MLRGLVIWLLIMAVETVHGVLRGIFLAPTVGEAMASRIGWPIGMVIVLAITLLCIRWTGLRDAQSLLKLGAIWAALTVLFEIAIGLARGLDATAIWYEINPLTGGLMIYSIIVMFAAPLLAARLRGVLRPA